MIALRAALNFPKTFRGIIFQVGVQSNLLI
jgi:hypothetical protein